MTTNDSTENQAGSFELRRTLNLIEHGGVRTIILRIRAPRPALAGRAWTSECSIEGILPNPRQIYGEDALDAFLNCISFCRGTLRDFNSENRLVWWLEKSDGGGLSKDMI